MSLLISEPPLQVIPTLAVKIGLNEAMFLQQVHYWSLRAATHHAGHVWVYNTVKQWHEQFPFWSEDTITRIIKSLRESGLLIVERLSPDKRNKTNFYRVDHVLLARICDSIPASCGNVDTRKLRQPIPASCGNVLTENTTENTTETPKPFPAADATGDGMVALPVDFLPDGNGGLVVAYRGDDPRAQPKKPNKGHRLPADWILPRAAGEWALSEGLTRDQVFREAERFKDYWHSKPGKEALKTDWAGTWRNWIRKAADDLAKHGKRNQGGASMFTELHTDRSWADGLSFIEKYTDQTWRAGL